MARTLEADAMNAVVFKRRHQENNIRVLFVVPGGTEGHKMIFALRQSASLQKEEVQGKLFFVASRTSPSLIVKECQRLRKEIKAFKPDIIHAHYGSMTSFMCMIVSRTPIVVTYRGSDLNPCPSIPWLRSVVGRFLSHCAALRAEQIICVSEQLKRRLFLGRSRSTVIPTGVDIKLFYPRQKCEARSDLGWGSAERVVLFNAGLFPMVKRLDLAQSAVNIARTICGEIRLEVLDGCVEPGLIPTIMNASDCLLITSDFEGSPNIVKEALACNLPIVSVDVGDVRERLAGVHPSWIARRYPEEIGRALVKILEKPSRSNGFETIQEVSLNRIATRIIFVYKAALRQNE